MEQVDMRFVGLLVETAIKYKIPAECLAAFVQGALLIHHLMKAPDVLNMGTCSCQDGGKCRYVNGGPACMNEE